MKREAVRAGKIDNVVSCSTEEESLLAKHQLVFSLVACVCRVSCVCVCSCEKKIERNNQRKIEGAVRGSTKEEQEAALREAAPTVHGAWNIPLIIYDDMMVCRIT